MPAGRMGASATLGGSEDAEESKGALWEPGQGRERTSRFSRDFREI